MMPTELILVDTPEIKAIEVCNEDGSIVLKIWKDGVYNETTVKEAD